MSVPADQMSPDQMNLMAALLRRQQGPLAWDQTQSDGSNAGGQRSQVGMNNMMMPLAQALMKSRVPKTYDMQGLPSGAFSESVPTATADAAGWAAPSAESLGEPAAQFTMQGAVPSASAGGGGGAALAGLGAGAGSMLALAAFNNYFRQNHEMTAQDYLKMWAGQAAKDKDLAAQEAAAGNVAGQKQYTATANTLQGLSNLTSSALAGKYVPNVTTVRDPGYQRKPF